MKKTLIATTLALFASTAFAAPAPIMPEVLSPEAVAATTTEAKTTDNAAPASVESLLLNPDAEIVRLNSEIFASNTERNLDRLTQATTFLKEEEVKTRIMQERMRQSQLYRAENEAIIEQYERINRVEGKNEVRKEEAIKSAVEEYQTQTQAQQIAQEAFRPVITDNLNVHSIYGYNGSLVAEITINDTKYQVKTGEKIEGFEVKAVTQHNVVLEKNGTEQEFKPSSKPIQFVSESRPVVQQEVKIPNIIKPYELK